ncbi:MAG: phosphomannomutase/phosphoglucomutase [Rhodospirillales bacterium]|nr:phosphomannomutase/phosphoglucomutase [Rhodospirillales bacterium]
MTGKHVLHPSILREYDIRGIVGETLTVDDVYAVGRAFGSIVRERDGKSVAVGYDGRVTSPVLEAALVDGLKACGVTVFQVGLGPTPMLYYAGYTLKADGALMITGSHNPPEHNGIKMMLGGKSFFGDQIKALGDRIAEGRFVDGDGSAEDRPLIDAYVDRLVDDHRGGKALRIAWDAGNGAAGEAMRLLTEKLPGHHVRLFADIDGSFPNHHPDPTVEKNLADLKAAVRDNDCDLGVGFDGDGDRIGVIDGQGRVLWGDQIMAILAREVLAERKGATVIADVKASQVLFDEIARLGGKPLMWKTGHSLIKSKMAETGAPLAGEMSGHIFFADRYYGFDDALYAAVRLISILANSEQSLADMRDSLPKTFATPEIRFDCSEERKFAVVEEVKARLKGETGNDVNDADGVRVGNDDGWWLLRASNTQAVLVARCEASSAEGLERLKAIVAGQLGQSGVAVPEFD